MLLSGVSMKAPGDEAVAVGVYKVAGDILSDRCCWRTRQAEVHGAGSPKRDIGPSNH